MSGGEAQRDAVHILSIHQSKGLEWPVVVPPDPGRWFNLGDLSGRVIADWGLQLGFRVVGARLLQRALDRHLNHRPLPQRGSAVRGEAGLAGRGGGLGIGAAVDTLLKLENNKERDWCGAWFVQHVRPVASGHVSR
jgi:hypothetical protein